MQEELIQKYLESLEKKSKRIHSLWEDHLQGDAAAYDSIRMEAHSLKGSGATFGFPEISEAGRDLEQANDTECRDKLISMLNLLGSISAKSKEAPPVGETPHPVFIPTKSNTALIIERNAANARIIGDCIQSLDRIDECVFADTGAKAREAFRKARFGLIVLDIVLPDQDGREILKEIKRSKTFNCPVLVISGVPSDTIYLECMRLGADEYLSKPFDTDKLKFEARQLTGEGHLQVAAPAEKAEPRKTNQLAGESFLVAEDDEMQAIFIEQALAAQGAEVTVVENGKLALEKLEKTTYSAVILDGMMPVMDGFETLRAIRQIPRQKGQPVIMVTAMGSEDNIIRGYQYGANDYILKPFSEDQIVSRIKGLLSIAATG